jgi:hypothetical protein
MPTYSFLNKKTEESFDQFFVSYSARDEFLEKNPDVVPQITAGVALVYDPGTNFKVTEEHKEAVAKVKSNFKINTIRDH